MRDSKLRKRYVIGNWKMNGSRSINAKLLKGLQLNSVTQSTPQFDNIERVVCPPSLYVQQVNAILRQGSTNIKVGAQNVSNHSGGAYTGELSASMLNDIGCQYVLVGHSERRNLFAEDSKVIAEKIAIALREGITPVFCVGENIEQFTSEMSENVVKQQLLDVVLKIGIKVFADTIIAYEPVWAIGTGKVATPAYAQRMHAYIRQELSEFDQDIADQMTILYGGSVNALNASSLFEQEDIDGALVGGASFNVDQFNGIVEALSCQTMSFTT